MNDLEKMKADFIAEVNSFPEIMLYIKIKDQLSNHDEINQLIEKIKETQKALVQAKKIQKPILAETVEQELTRLNEKLLAYPIYQQFLTAAEQAQLVIDDISELVDIELINSNL